MATLRMTVKQVQLYSIDQAEMENYALPDGESITLYPRRGTPPELDMERDEGVEIHVKPDNQKKGAQPGPIYTHSGATFYGSNSN